MLKQILFPPEKNACVNDFSDFFITSEELRVVTLRILTVLGTLLKQFLIQNL